MLHLEMVCLCSDEGCLTPFIVPCVSKRVYLVIQSAHVQGSVSRGILGGRVRPVEEQVLQMLRVPVLTGLSEDEQIVGERWKEGEREGERAGVEKIKEKFSKEV